MRRPGRTPSERELAEHFSVSRGQIREALAILEAMRIVERRAKSGIYLTTRQASVEAMALFAKAGVPLDPIQIYETVELQEDPRDQGGRARLLARHRGELRAAARDPESLGGAAGGGRSAVARGPRLPPGDRARHPEQRLPQDLQHLLRDGRAAAAGLFQRPRARPPVACRASADIRCAAAPRRQPCAGADERAPAGRRELLEGPDRRAGQAELRRRRSRKPDGHGMLP